MAGIKLPQFLRRYDLTLLGVATDDIIPGAVLGKKRGHMYEGHLRELFNKPAKFWAVEHNQANIVYGSVERSLSLSGKASMNEMGASIGGGLARARSVDFQITEVTARTFKNGSGRASMFSLVDMIHALRKRNKARWKKLNNRRVVLETYYATKVTATFKTSGNVDLKAEIDKAGGVKVGGNAGIKWNGNKSFTISNNKNVPFAFRGWKV